MGVPMGGGYAPIAGRVDFGWLGRAWALFSARSWLWGGAMFLYFLCATALWLLWAIPTGVLAQMQQAYAAALSHTVPTIPYQNPYLQFVKTRVFSLLLAGLNAIFLGGLYKMALRQARGERVSALGVFSAFPQAVPLLMVAVAVTGAVSLLEGFFLWLLHLARLPSPQQAILFSSLLVLLPSWLAQTLVMFAPLLVVDKGANAAEAITGSFRLLGGQWLMAALFLLVAGLIGYAGSLLCGIGLLATYPLLLLSIAVGYLAFTQPPLTAAFPPYDTADAPPGVWPPPPRLGQ